MPVSPSFMFPYTFCEYPLGQRLFLFFQARLYWAPTATGGSEDKQQFPLLAPFPECGQAGSLHGVRVGLSTGQASGMA